VNVVGFGVHQNQQNEAWGLLGVYLSILLERKCRKIQEKILIYLREPAGILALI
jgi:hypothetical protein